MCFQTTHVRFAQQQPINARDSAGLNIHQGPLTSQRCHQGPVAAGVGVDRGLADKKTAFRFQTRSSGFKFFLALAGHSRQITGGQAEVMTSIHVWTFRNYFAILPEVAFQGNHQCKKSIAFHQCVPKNVC